MKKLKRAKDGEWIQPQMKGFLMGCCDCGLVHRIDFRIVKERVQLRAFRAPRYTIAQRRRDRIIFKKESQ